MKTISVASCMLLSVLSVVAQTSTTPSGSGTSENPYLIESLANLNWVRVQTNNGNSFSSSYFRQTQDIDATATSGWSSGAGWIPIGYATNWTSRPFSGNYDGNGKKITGLHINRPSESSVGLFGRTSSSVIKNLTLEDVSIVGRGTVGGIAGLTWNCNLSDLSVSGSVTGMEYYIGGLVGNNSADIMRCSSSAEVVGGSYVGGLIGWNYLSSKIVAYSFSTGDVSGTDYVGGFLGHQNSGQIHNCYARGQVTLTGSESTNYRIGGFAGNSPNSGSIAKSYSTGSIVIEDGTTRTDKGFEGSGSLLSINNFFDTNTSGQLTNRGALARATAEMQTPLNYLPAFWDFKGAGSEGVWNVGNERNGGYPYFVWQYPDDPAHPDANGALVVTTDVSGVTTSSVVLEGDIVRIGDPVASEYGFCWNTAGMPTLEDTRLPLGVPPGVGDFSVSIDVEDHSIQANTLYYFRAYAINADGVFYGEPMAFVLAPEGAGTEENPFVIESLADLLWISMESLKGEFFIDQYFLQTDNIDASATQTWNDGAGWRPIDNFYGIYNGNGNTISGLYINRPERNYVGLFGRSEEIHITGLGLVDCDITGGNYTGAIIGGLGYLHIWGHHLIVASITDCFSTGLVAGNEFVGGIAGFTSEWIENCYSRANLSGSAYVGGIAGSNGGHIENVFSTGVVEADEGAGGLVGENSGVVRNSFWDVETSGLEISAGGLALATEGMVNVVTFLEAGWLFKGVELDDPLWNIGGGRNDGYPYLIWQFPEDPPSEQLATAQWRPLVSTLAPVVSGAGAVTFQGNLKIIGNPTATQHGFCWSQSDLPTIEDSRSLQGAAVATGEFIYELTEAFAPGRKYFVRAYATNALDTVYGDVVFFITPPAGSGTEADPYRIDTLAGLEWMSLEFQNGNDFTGTYFVQTADIDAAGTAHFEWTPIGRVEDIWEEVSGFNGQFDGGNFSIVNFTLDKTESITWDWSIYGLFGVIAPEGVVRNLRLENATVASYNVFTAGIAGLNFGLIDSCSVSGLVIGEMHYIGALVGENYGTIRRSFSDCQIVANGADIGGLVGANFGLIEDCYFVGTMSGGGWRWGGIAGWNDQTGVIRRCYTNTVVPHVEFDDWADVGPVYGANYDGVIEGSYWDTSVYSFGDYPPEQHIYMVGARTSSEMTYPYSTDTYVDWDFAEVWAADTDGTHNNGYPYLRAPGDDPLPGDGFTLTYHAGPGGSIVGPSPQTVATGENSGTMFANPDTGAEFHEWSDGSTANPRVDENVQADIEVTAHFRSTGGVEIDWYAGHGIAPGAGQTWADLDGLDWLGKGMTLREEFIAGTNPNDPQSRFVAEPPLKGPGGLITLRWSSIAGRTYGVEWSQNLQTWQELETTPGVPLRVPAALDAGHSEISFDDPSTTPGAPIFFRVRVNP